MPCIISIVGKSDSGKTTLLEKLVREVYERGYRVGSIKHDTHGFDIDHEGKDSWRHKQAGARLTVIASPTQVALIEDTERDYEIAELVEKYIHDIDIVLMEGFKGNPYPKIEVYRHELKRALLSADDKALLALATDTPLDVAVPCYDINDARGMADLIEKKFLLHTDAP